MKTTRILIADDHSLMRAGLISLINVTKDLESVGEATNGRDAVELVRKLRPDVVVMDLMMPELNGASGALMKDTATADFLKTIRTVASGDSVISDPLLRMAKEDTSARDLTDRQREMLTYAAKGISYPEIAKQLSITVITVKKTMQVIFTKIGAANRAEAISIAYQKHLLNE